MDNSLFKNLNSSRGGGIAFSLMMVVFVLINFIGQAILGAIFGTESVYFTAICSCFSPLAMCVVIAVFRLGGNVKLKNLIGFNGFKWYYALIAFALSAAMFFGLGFVNDVLIGFLENLGVKLGGINIPLDTVGQYILFSVVLALLPAVFEEIFFRGLIIRCLDGVKPLYVVIAVSSCFALYHCSAAQLIYQLIYGVLLTLLALSAKSSIPSVIAHFINNFAIITLEYFKVSVNLYHLLGIILGIISLIAITTALVLLLKKNKIENAQNNGSQKISWFYIFGSLGILVCVLMAASSIIFAVITGGTL